MDGSHFAPDLQPPHLQHPHLHEPRREDAPLPEREWTLGPAQVLAAVLIIVALCQLT